MAFKLGYLILAHDDMPLLERLVCRLSLENVYFFIHIDTKCIESYNQLMERRNVYILNRRFDIKWGDISVVDAVLSLSRFALNHPIKSDYYILLSGHDYPVKNAKYIYNYIKNIRHFNLTIGFSLPTDRLNWTDNGMLRVRGYPIRLNERKIATILPQTISLINVKQLFKILYYNPSKIKTGIKILFKSKRVFPNSLIPYGGELWFRVTSESLKKMINYIDNNPNYHAYMKAVTIPDEIYFNTLIHNLSENNQNSNLTFINWTGKSSPEWIMTQKDLKRQIDNSDCLFARKFKNTPIIDFIDCMTND